MSKTIRPTIDGVFPQLPDGLHDVALGNGTQYRVMIHRTDTDIAFGILGLGCYVFSHGDQDPMYVSEKMGIRKMHEGDARNFSDFITSQFSQTFTRLGNYYPTLCATN